jgi:CheY-like chemotaxis protein
MSAVSRDGLMAKPLNVLFVEDADDDRMIVRFALRKAEIRCDARFVKDVYEFQDYMLGMGVFASQVPYPLPDVIVSDIKMPGLNGFDLLRWVKSSEHLRQIPVFLLSSAFLERDRTLADSLGAELLLRKPSNTYELAELLKMMFSQTVTLDELAKESVVES